MAEPARRGALDWAGMMRAGLCRLRLRPAEFWALSPHELMVMLGLDAGGAAPMARARLDELLRAFPDAPPDSTRETCDARD